VQQPVAHRTRRAAIVTEPKSKAPRRAKRRRRPREEIVYYIVAIEDWDWGYSLSLNLERQPIDPYHEFRHLHVRARLLHPPILQMMVGERFKFVVMHGTQFRHRRATLHGFRLEMKLDPDDLPEGSNCRCDRGDRHGRLGSSPGRLRSRFLLIEGVLLRRAGRHRPDGRGQGARDAK
jgi:hypothetical protein